MNLQQKLETKLTSVLPNKSEQMIKKIGLSVLFFFCIFTLSAQETLPTPIIDNQGFSTNSLIRGVIGMISLLAIAFIFSSNRKAINWKTVGAGISAQLLIAVGVLKVPFIQAGFEFVGGIFTNILDYTAAGSIFLFGGLMDVDSYGFIFVLGREVQKSFW